MPRPVPTIVPLAAAYIRRHGPQTAEALSQACGFGIGSVRRALMNAVDLGQLAIARREVPARGGYLLHYGLVKRIRIPKISAGEWRGYMPTGSIPSEIRRLVP